MFTWLSKLLTFLSLFSGAYQTFKFLQDESKQAKEKRKEKEQASHDNQTEEDSYEIGPDGIILLKFWTILGFVQIFDSYFERFVYWLPFYEFGKFFFIAFISYPKSALVVVIFENIVSPIIAKIIDTVYWKILPKASNRINRQMHRIQTFAIKNLVVFLSAEEIDHWKDRVDNLLDALIDEKKLRFPTEAASKDVGGLRRRQSKGSKAPSFTASDDDLMNEIGSDTETDRMAPLSNVGARRRAGFNRTDSKGRRKNMARSQTRAPQT